MTLCIFQIIFAYSCWHFVYCQTKGKKPEKDMTALDITIQQYLKDYAVKQLYSKNGCNRDQAR